MALQLLNDAADSASGTNALFAAVVFMLEAVMLRFDEEENSPEAQAPTTGPLLRPRPSTVRIFHNIDIDVVTTYRPGHRLVEVYTFDEPTSRAETDRTVADRVLTQFSTEYDAVDLRAIEYFQAGNRALSVGDVIAIDDRFYARGSSGWDRIESPTLELMPHRTVPMTGGSFVGFFAESPSSDELPF
ncbi:hypothetical protein [Saccharopolyspora elongata]|uniref:Uncharacterized protein n=1 Tax=Saccharopolyspora elongata TaxID=2530387 RepID=A0A4R4XV36_9PSEU|nr:hypothetical protein [Saccharopolyspora elongata]TDD35491.1 hypothetical protein E1288_43095 [Saccharopolyspora elongata]